MLRQITIEGITKMLFSIKISNQLQTKTPKQKIENADEEEQEMVSDEQEQGENGVITVMSQLLIQWFDFKFNWKKSLMRQTLNLFFQHFILFSTQRRELMVQSLLRVVYSVL